ncbi:hypothetical protein J4208_00460 [Candidatus Woesearchaeota archaeon]|nr:hypothetical protein [Candidatus Woesearchaeota archaeon]
MVLVSELPTLEDIARAKLLLFLADPNLLSKDASYAVDRKRQLLVMTALKCQQLPTLDAPEDYIHKLFVRRYKTALKLVRAFERFPVPVYLATEQTAFPHDALLTATALNRREGLTERIAIMLDSCTPAELTDLTTTFGKDALGDYAREFGQPLSRQNRPLTAF